MGALATGIQWTAGVVLAMAVVVLLIAPFATVWVLGVTIALLVATAVWGLRLQRRDSTGGDTTRERRVAGAEQTPAERAR